MIESIVSNGWLWFLATIVIGIALLKVVPKIYKEALAAKYLIKYSTYFNQRMVYEYIKSKSANGNFVDAMQTIVKEVEKFKQGEVKKDGN